MCALWKRRTLYALNFRSVRSSSNDLKQHFVWIVNEQLRKSIPEWRFFGTVKQKLKTMFALVPDLQILLGISFSFHKLSMWEEKTFESGDLYSVF